MYSSFYVLAFACIRCFCYGLCLCSILAVYAEALRAQGYLIEGKVTDSETGEGIPFANVYLPQNRKGTTTDFDGNFSIRTDQLEDSLTASYVGYYKRSKPLQQGQAQQTVFFQLEPENQSLNEIVITMGENPAWDIIRKAVKNKNTNDRRSLQSYAYESYSRAQLDINNITERFEGRRDMRSIIQAIDSIGFLNDDEGKRLVPIFVSETVSRYYHNQNPEKQKEIILKNKTQGVGVREDGVLSQLVVGSFQDYNFYQNWIRLVEKEFVSPIADSWRLYYEYYLIDSSFIDQHFCYQIELEPKRPQDLAFRGTIWIDSESYALKQLDLYIPREANINYVNQIKIQQTAIQTPTGAWLTNKSRIIIDVAALNRKAAGILAKFYLSNQAHEVNQEYPLSFFDERITRADDAYQSDAAYWQTHRHEPLSARDLQVFAMIDTIKNVRVVKSYVEVIDILTSGYKTVGKIDIGNYLYTYAYNTYEGHRVRFGARTNESLSKHIVLEGYGAYGTLDQRWKYGGDIRWIIGRKPWTEIGLTHRFDIAQIVFDEDILNVSMLFKAALFWGDMRKRQPYYLRQSQAYIQRDLLRGFTQKLSIQHRYFESIDNLTQLNFFKDSQSFDPVIEQDFEVAELVAEWRYAPKEVLIRDGNRRISLGTRFPVFTFRYHWGVPGLLGNNFEYHKFWFNISQKVRLGTLGDGKYSFSAGYTDSPLPYPMLFVQLGNPFSLYSQSAFGMMGFAEFIQDRYISFHYEHYFNGLITNHIPLIRKLKWRAFMMFDALYGGISSQSIALIPEANRPFAFTQEGQMQMGLPYLELNYGLENIFKVLRVHVFHRLTYLDRPAAQPWGLKLSARIRL